MIVLALACARSDDADSPSLPSVCDGASTDLLDAPDPLDGVAALDLIDVVVDATVEADGVTIIAEATFLVGEDGGRPALELAPTGSLQLDGDEVEVSRRAISDPPRDIVVLPELAACSTHTLTATHTLPLDWYADQGDQVRLEGHPGGVFWSAGLEDNQPGLFLSVWMPSNLLFDRFDLTLDLDVSALPEEHQLVTTGSLETTKTGWRAHWTGVQAHAPFWVLSPTGITVSDERAIDLPDGDVLLEVHALVDDPGADVDSALDRGEVAIRAFTEDYGSYDHDGRYVIWIRDEQGGAMEYDGATVTNMGAIEHEIHHSWFGRGAAPVADLHGWVDEAMTSWVTDLFPHRAVAFDDAGGLQTLQIGQDEWAGASLDIDQYVFGSSIFAGIAHDHGVDAVIEAMAAFYQARKDRPYRSEELEEHLVCWFDDDAIRGFFAKRAHGRDDAPPRPDGWCQ